MAEIRRQNLAKLVSKYGLSRVAKRVKRSSTQINDTIAGRKSFGEKVARAIEREWDASRRASWLDHYEAEITRALSATPPPGYIRLEHLSPEPSMGRGATITEPEQIIEHLDVLERWVRQNVGSADPKRVKILTGDGNSMAPTIQDQDLVFVDVGCRTIEGAGIYVLDVVGRLVLKRAMILSNGTLILRSDNTKEYPDEERYDLRHIAEQDIVVCGKALAWWTLRKG